jgi:hypothetical protein
MAEERQITAGRNLRPEPALGIAAILFYAVHGAVHVARGHAENLLWACHVACLAVGIGLAVRSPHAVAAGFLFLVVGVPLWLLDLATGGEFLVTSTLTHVGGLAIGAWGVKRLGVPKGAWWRSLAGLFVLHVASRFTPPGENVNLAHRVWPGWESWFPNHTVYAAANLAMYGAAFAATQFGLRKAGIKSG